MRDGLTWFAALLVVASVFVAVWCARLPAAQTEPAADVREGLLPVGDALITMPASHRPTAAPAGSCTFGEVLIIAAHGEPEQSTASVRMRDGTMETRRAGQTLEGYVVEAIELDQVAFRRGEERCRLYIGEAPASAVATTPTESKPGAPGWLADAKLRKAEQRTLTFSRGDQRGEVGASVL